MNLKAAGVISCYAASNTTANPVAPALNSCYTQANFSLLTNNVLNWAYLGTPGTAGVTPSGTSYDPSLNGGAPWGGVHSTANSWGVLGVGVNTGPGFALGSDASSLLATYVNELGTAGVRTFGGHFIQNDVVMGFDLALGPMQLSFDSPIAAIGFFVSVHTATAGAAHDSGGFPMVPVDATIRAFAVDPRITLGAVPILSYRVTDTGGGGICGSMGTCNDAPYIGINGGGQLFNYITITSNDTSSQGLFVDTLSIEEVPEPATALLIGGGMLLLVIGSRKLFPRAK